MIIELQNSPIQKPKVEEYNGRWIKEFGSTLSAPFVTFSFIALLFITHLKLSDKGLFNGNSLIFE